jgi:hypothetical protein
MVQDHPSSLNESLLLPTLESLSKTHVRNQELLQPGDSRPPGYATVSKRNSTRTQDLDPNLPPRTDHPSSLPLEMHAIEPGETPPRILKWSPLGFLSHIKRRIIGDRFPLPLWEVWFCSTLGVPIPALIGPSQWCACNAFDYGVC